MEAMMNFSGDELLIMQDFTSIELIKAKCITEKDNVLVLVVYKKVDGKLKLVTQHKHGSLY
jgi:hypothetical protein